MSLHNNEQYFDRHFSVACIDLPVYHNKHCIITNDILTNKIFLRIPPQITFLKYTKCKSNKLTENVLLESANGLTSKSDMMRLQFAMHLQFVTRPYDTLNLPLHFRSDFSK